MGTARCVGQIQADVGRAVLGRSVAWTRLGVPRRSWALLGVLGRSLGAWGGLGAVWAPSWGGAGAVLGRSWAVLGRLGSVLSPSWRVSGRSCGRPVAVFGGRVAIGRNVKNDIFSCIFTNFYIIVYFYVFF